MKIFRRLVLLTLSLTLLGSGGMISLADYDMTSSEVKSVEMGILDMQKSLYDHINDTYSDVLDEIMALSNYKNTGDLEFKVDSKNDFGDMSIKSLFENFEINISNEDLDISSDVNLEINTIDNIYGEMSDLDFKSRLSVIYKDSALYVGLDDIETTRTGDFTDVVDTFNELLGDAKYIKIDDSDGQIKYMISSYTGSDTIKLFSVLDLLNTKSLLTPYKKDGDKYYLIPTKSACDAYFEVVDMGYFMPSSCNEVVYKTLINKFTKKVDLYYISGDYNTLGFSMNDDGIEINAELAYDTGEISSFVMDIIDHTSDENTLNISYKNKESFNIIAQIGDLGVDYMFNSTLDSNNYFTQINARLVADNLNANLTLKDNKLNGILLYKERSTGMMGVLRTSGDLENDNTIKTLSTQGAILNTKTKDVYFALDFKYNKGNYRFKSYLSSGFSDDFRLVVKGDGNMGQKYIDLNSKYTLSYTQKMLDFDYLDNSTIGLTSDYKDVSRTYNGKLSLKADTRDDKNDLDIKFDVKTKADTIFNLDVIIDSDMHYGDSKSIKTPSDYAEIDDIYSLLYGGGY